MNEWGDYTFITQLYSKHCDLE